LERKFREEKVKQQTEGRNIYITKTPKNFKLTASLTPFC